MIKHIVVTQEHIDKGIPENPHSCPVYLAIDEVCKDVSGVFGEYITFIERQDDYEDFYKVIAPMSVGLFVEAFDDSRDHPMVKPFEFDLELPDNVKCD